MSKKTGCMFRIVIVLLIVAAVGYAGLRYWQVRQAEQQAGEVLGTMEQLIPNLGVDIGTAGGNGRDPLAALSIQDIDIVGCLEIPAIDLRAPVTAAGYDRAGFAAYYSGSPVKGRFRLTGSRRDVFRRLAKCSPGDRVIFTDVDGVRYTYEVVTQFHLKDWDTADYDLMLSYETTDSRTDFVLGCNRTI